MTIIKLLSSLITITFGLGLPTYAFIKTSQRGIIFSSCVLYIGIIIINVSILFMQIKLFNL